MYGVLPGAQLLHICSLGRGLPMEAVNAIRVEATEKLLAVWTLLD